MKIEVAAIHRDELIADAENARLVRLARGGEPKRRHKRGELNVDRAERSTPPPEPADGPAGDKGKTDRPEWERDHGFAEMTCSGGEHP